MASHGKETSGKPAQPGKADATARPDWADGLKQLYDSVVDEPLPDNFKDLLDKLDEGDDGKTGSAD